MLTDIPPRPRLSKPPNNRSKLMKIDVVLMPVEMRLAAKATTTAEPRLDMTEGCRRANPRPPPNHRLKRPLRGPIFIPGGFLLGSWTALFQWPIIFPRGLALAGFRSGYPAPTWFTRLSGNDARDGCCGSRHPFPDRIPDRTPARP